MVIGLHKKRRAGENIILEFSERRVSHKELEERFQLTAAAKQIIHCGAVDHRYFNAELRVLMSGFCLGVRENCRKVIRIERCKRPVMLSNITITDDLLIALIKITLSSFDQPGM